MNENTFIYFMVIKMKCFLLSTFTLSLKIHFSFVDAQFLNVTFVNNRDFAVYRL